MGSMKCYYKKGGVGRDGEKQKEEGRIEVKKGREKLKCVIEREHNFGCSIVRKTDRQTDRQIDEQPDRQTGGPAESQKQSDC